MLHKLAELLEPISFMQIKASGCFVGRLWYSVGAAAVYGVHGRVIVGSSDTKRVIPKLIPNMIGSLLLCILIACHRFVSFFIWINGLITPRRIGCLFYAVYIKFGC